VDAGARGGAAGDDSEDMLGGAAEV